MSHEFRCPVCGHADDVPADEPGTLSVVCANCDTALTVEIRDSDALGAEARVAEGGGDAEEGPAG